MKAFITTHNNEDMTFDLEYSLDKRLGYGTFAEVYPGTWEDKQVAIKITKRKPDELF